MSINIVSKQIDWLKLHLKWKPHERLIAKSKSPINCSSAEYDIHLIDGRLDLNYPTISIENNGPLGESYPYIQSIKPTKI